MYEYPEQLSRVDTVLLRAPSTGGMNFLGELFSGNFNISPIGLCDFIDDMAEAPVLTDFLYLAEETGLLKPLINCFAEPVLRTAVYKGIAEKDAKGLPKTTTERLTKADKIKFASLMFDDMMADALANASDEVKDALNREGITKEEQIDILAGFVKPRELPKFSGSKVANPGKITGVGTSVTFTDTNVWNQLKADMGDEASTKNREFAVDVDNLIELPINNGYEIVTVKAIVLGDYTDKEPARVGEKE
jgi:hypothetical protein